MDVPPKMTQRSASILSARPVIKPPAVAAPANVQTPAPNTSPAVIEAALAPAPQVDDAVAVESRKQSSGTTPAGRKFFKTPEKGLASRTGERPVAKQYKTADLESMAKSEGEPLPVLNAIRDFIDQERRRTRKTVIQLVGFILVIMLGFIVLGVHKVRGMSSTMKRGLETMSLKVNESFRKVEASQARLENETMKLKASLQDGGKPVEAALASVSAVEGKVADTLAQIDALKKGLGDAVDGAKIGNDATLAQLNEKWAEITVRIDDLAKENAALRQELSQIKVGGGTTVAPDTAVAPAPEDLSVDVDATPGNTERKINWRLPVPSI